MSDQSRRHFLQATSVAAAGAVLADPARAADRAEEAAAPAPIRAFAPVHRIRPLPFDPARLDGLSEKLIRSHWENNYAGSVKTLNAVKERLAHALADKETPAFLYGDLKREHLMRTGSVVLHELYFGNLGGGGKADADVRRRLGEVFGDFDTWETEYRKVAAGLGGGAGWVVLGYNLHSGQIENYWLADHLHSAAATWPLLVMDMYEHSYQMDYGAAAARYIDAFFRNIRWETVAERLEGARRAAARPS